MQLHKVNGESFADDLELNYQWLQVKNQGRKKRQN